MKTFCITLVSFIGCCIFIGSMLLAQYVFINGPDWLLAANIREAGGNKGNQINLIIILSTIVLELVTVIATLRICFDINDSK